MVGSKWEMLTDKSRKASNEINYEKSWTFILKQFLREVFIFLCLLVYVGNDITHLYLL